MTHQPELGIESPYELNTDQYKVALDLLRVQRQLVSRYWHDAFIQIDDFKNEGMAASGSWPFQVNLLQGDKQPIASVIPEEGATGWADTTMMHVEAENPNCAYMWMEHTLSSNLMSDLSVWFGANPAVLAACTDGRGMQTAEGCTRNGLDDFDKIRFWQTPITRCESQDECADRVAVFNDGKVQQTDKPQDLYDRPCTPFVATFVGSSNLLPETLVAKLRGIHKPASLRPESIVLANGGLAATVVDHAFLGANNRLDVIVDETLLSVLMPKHRKLPTAGETVYLSWADDALHIMHQSDD